MGTEQWLFELEACKRALAKAECERDQARTRLRNATAVVRHHIKILDSFSGMATLAGDKEGTEKMNAISDLLGAVPKDLTGEAATPAPGKEP